MQQNEDPMSGWARWLLIGACAALVGLVILGVAVFLCRG
jgi:hypothetical protein